MCVTGFWIGNFGCRLGEARACPAGMQAIVQEDKWLCGAV